MSPMRMILILISAVSAIAVGGFVPAEAKAPDQRPCVSLREYRGGGGNVDTDDITRRHLEARWEVRGERAPEFTDENILGVTYRACGYGKREAGVLVLYRRFRYHGVDHSVLASLRWEAEGATPGAPVRQAAS